MSDSPENPPAVPESGVPVSEDVTRVIQVDETMTEVVSAAEIDGEAIGPRRNLNMPGVGVSVAEQIEALGRIAGPEAVGLIREEPDETIWAIVKNWPTRFDARRARELGFVAETDFDAIIRAYVEDELARKAA